MKKLFNNLLILLTIITSTSLAFGTEFRTGEKITVDKPMDGDLYIGAGEIYILSPIYGDLIAAGGEITIDDSVAQDLLIAGGQLIINGVIGDDIRASGGRVKIRNLVMGDLVVFGGVITIERTSVINGNLIIYGGEVEIAGSVMGEVKASGGDINFSGIAESTVRITAEEVEINGVIKGTSTIVADDIFIGEQAKFYQKVDYWREDGELDFGSSLANTSAQFKPELVEHDIESFPLGSSFGVLTLFYVLSTLLVLILLNFLFDKPLTKAGSSLHLEPTKSLGYGVIYSICLPILVLLLLVTIIAIPIGLLLLTLYIFSWVFGLSIASVTAVNAMKIKYNYQPWSTWKTVMVSAAAFFVLKLLSLIPFVGWLFYFLVVAWAFGAILINLLPKKNTNILSKAQQ